MYFSRGAIHGSLRAGGINASPTKTRVIIKPMNFYSRAELIEEMKRIALLEGEFTLRRLSFPPLSAQTSDPYSEWPISVSVDGRYHDLAILFNKLGNFSRIMNVEQIGIRALPGQETRTISADFTAKTFVYVEPKKDEAAPAGDAKPGGGA